MKMTYICSPCRGDYEKNIKRAQEYCRQALFEGLLPIAPHVYFTQFVDDTNTEERKRALSCGLQILRYCQLIRVYGCAVSSGMLGEIQLAGILGIEIEVYGPPEFIKHVHEIYQNAKEIQQEKPEMQADTGHAYLKITLDEQGERELEELFSKEMRGAHIHPIRKESSNNVKTKSTELYQS